MYSLESKNLFNILNRHNLLSEESLSNLCRIAVEIINKELNTRTSAIFLFSKDGKLRRRAIAGLENGWLQEECYDIGESIIGKTVRPYSEDSRYGEWRLYEDLEKDWGNNKYFHYYKERFGDIKRAICIPLNGPNRTFGVIRVIDKLDSKNLPVRFEENDALLLTMLSHQIATTISRIRRKAELDAISEVSKLLINRESSLQDIYDIVTNIFVREWTDYSACILRIRDKDVLRLVSLSCDQNVSCKFKDRSDRKIAEGYVGKVFDSGQPVTVKNILQYKSEFRDLNWIEQNGLISFGCFPIRTKKKIIGTLSLFAKFEFEFYPSQLTFIKNLSEQVVTATDIHHLIDTRDKISEFVSDINSNIDRLDNVLQMIVDSGMELTNADFGYIALTSKKNSLLIPQKWTSNLQHNNIPSIDIDGEGLTAEAVRKGKSINIGNVRASGNKNKFVDLSGIYASKVKSELVVPLIYENQVVGVLNMESVFPNHFRNEDQILIESLAHKATLAYQRLKIYEATRLLANLTFTITNKPDIYRTILKTTAEICDVSVVLLWIIDESNPENLTIADYAPKNAFDVEEIKTLDMRKGKGRSWQTIETHDIKIFQDLSHDPEIYHKEFVKKYSLYSMLAVPLFTGDKAFPQSIRNIGILNIFARRPYVFFEAEKQLLKALAVSAAFAIHDAWLFEQKERFQQLAERNARMMGFAEMAGGLAHDTKNILNNINTAFLLLRNKTYQKFKIDEKSSIDTAFSTIEENLEKLQKYFDNLRRYSRHSKPNFENCNINYIVKDVYRLVEHRIRKMKIRYKEDLRSLPEVRCDKDQILQVLTNVVINALDALKERGSLFIGTELFESEKWIRIRIIDNGYGIEDSLKPKLFDPLFTTKKGGTGLGLSVSKQIVHDLHHGRIDFISRRGKGTTFHIFLPNKTV